MNICFVGLAGVPYSRRACDVRLYSFAIVFSRNHNITVLNRYSCIKDSNDFPINNNIHIIEIIKKNNIKKFNSFFFILSIFKEPFRLFSLNNRNKIDILHVYSGHFFDYIFYWLIGKIINAKIVYQYVEYRSGKPKKNLYHNINSYLCDNKGAMLWDGVITISSFLDNAAHKVSHNVISIKVPSICDFIAFNVIESYHGEKYLLFCGSIGYLDIINLIVDSYRQSKLSSDVKLKLVLSGRLERVNAYKIENPDIDVYTDLKYYSLIGLYKGAIGLFIPLRNSIEDIARFPNKICEYVASHGMIITTNFGDVSDYFVDKETAIIAQDCNVPSLIEKLNWIFDNMDRVSFIKQNAYQLGLRVFDQYAYEEKLNNFLQEVVDK